MSQISCQQRLLLPGPFNECFFLDILHQAASYILSLLFTMKSRVAFLILLLSLCAVVAQTAVVWQSKQKALWVNGQRFNLKGISWFGFETGDYVVHGLWAVDYKFMIDFLAANSFNAVRLPFSLDMVLNNPNTNTISYWCSNNQNCNSDLKNLKSLQVMDKIISYMGTKGIAVLLDMHSFGPGQAGSNGYWYDGSHSEATVIQGWTTLATRYKNYWNVMGMDIKNEPFSCTWGSGNLNTDFNLAAQRIGNAITANSNWLVFVEGITCQSGCFWGENLQGVQFNPVILNVPNRVVYSPHAYGPDVFPMTYFNDASFPTNMPAIWDTHFGYIRTLNNTDAAVVTGEWGGTTTNANDLTWLNAFSSYLKTKSMTDNFFWAVNQNSGQTGGIVQGDWITPETAKLAIIASVVPNPTNLLSVINSTANYTGTNSTSNTTSGTNTTNTNTTNTTKTNTTNTTNITNANTTTNSSTTNTSCNIVYTSQQGVLKINGQRFYLKGASWFGFQTGIYTVHGLWSVDYKFLIDFLASNQFNAVRLPFSLDMVLNSPYPSSISYGYCTNNVNCNKDLQGLTSLQVMDKLISYMGTKGILVMLDMHSFAPDAYASNGLWYDSSHSEAMVIQGWKNLVARYKNVWNVFAIDIKNEPFQATWGTGTSTTDFNMAAQRIGNAVVSDTNWLVFVEGTANSPNCVQGCFYGENLQGVQTSPVVLNVPNRVVYSPHTYGPNVYNQPYFSDGAFPNNMPAIWDAHFGFIKGLGASAVVTGQWGGSTSGQNGVWLNSFVSYLKSKDMTDNFVWCLNPDSGDTGGLLGNDWITPDLAKLNLLASLVSTPSNVLSLANSARCTGGSNTTSTNTTNTTPNCTTNCNNSTTNGTNSSSSNSTGNNSTTNKTNNSGSCPGPYSSQQGVLKINGQRFNLKGASWFGFQTGIKTVHGLWSVDYKFLVDFLASNQFNAVRLPFSLDMVLGNSNPSSISYGYCTNNVNCNKDLQGLSSLQVMDKIISYMGTKGILVMLDMHSFAPDAFASNGLWYDSSHSEAMVIQGWRALVSRYQSAWNVFAIDIKNEPFQATWGTGANATDFNLAAQRIGNAVVNDTNWLVFVEGTANSPSCVKNCFYGEDLQGVQTNPVVLSVPNRVVYSPHTYGPNVYNQPYFSDGTFPNNMPAIWDAHFGFIKGLGTAAVVTGQWGGSTSGQNGVWLNAFVSYLKSKDMADNFVWCLNPDSGDTGGLLADDWITPDLAKLNLLASLVPNPSNVQSLMNASTCSGGNSTNSTVGGGGNATNSTNGTNSSSCLAGQRSDGLGGCLNCTVFACSSCQTNVSICTACLPSLYIDSYGTFCQLCLLAPSYNECSQDSCSSYVYYNNQCTSLCSNIPNTNPSQPTPINDVCLCNSGYVWTTNINSTQCLACSSPFVTQSQCSSSQCPSYFWSTFGTAQFCNNCASMGATQNTTASCICPVGTFWDASTSYCYSCSNVPVNLCGTMTSCSSYYVDSLGSCTACGANTINRAAGVPQSSCVCASGYAWSNGSCTSCATTQGQFFINNTCYNCPTVNALMNGSVPQSNATTGCKCSGNYLFLLVGSSYQCTCNNTAGFFDLGNNLGCGVCSSIAGAIAFVQSSSSCSCTSLLTWSSTFQKCKCANSGMYLKYNTVCASCLETPTNTGVNPNTINSCNCIAGTVWNTGYSQCVCIGTGTTQNQYYDGSKCVVCDASTLGLMNGYNKCLCPANSLWTTLTYSCVCNSLSIPISNVCTKCSTIPFALTPTTTKLACNCASGWTWNPTSNICVCASASCSCATMPNTAFSTTSKTCQPCASFDSYASPTWPSNQTQCTCIGAFQWQTLTNTCVCPTFTSANPVISTGPGVCFLCDHTLNALNYGGVSNATTKQCNCFPNYNYLGYSFCVFTTINTNAINVQFLNGRNTTCTLALTVNVSSTPLDNYNCICTSNTSIFNDLTGTCVACPLGKVNAVACKCPAGQDWNIFMMSCTSTSPPGGQYANPSYTKCSQNQGLASRTLIAYSSTDANQVFVSGEYDFVALATQSTLYAKFAAYKCNCSIGYGWNYVRKRCYPNAYHYAY